MNSELSKEAADLVKVGRDALRPTVDDRARVLAALKAQLPAALEPTATGVSGASGVGVGTKALVLAAGVAATIAAVAVFSARGPEQAPPSVPSSDVPGAVFAPTVPEPPAGFGLPAPMVTAAPAPAPVGSSGVGNRATPADRLGEEVALLTRAQREFHAGNLKAALASVDEHRRKFARGRLGQERVKLRVKILCGLGRVAEATSEQRKLGSSKSGPEDVCGQSQ